jgi:hypothetical protein
LIALDPASTIYGNVVVSFPVADSDAAWAALRELH